MAVEREKLVERREPALLATLVSLGCQTPSFEEATGWEYGVRHHTYESGAHYGSREDLARLRETVASRAASDRQFWSDYLQRCATKGSRLIGVAHSLAGLAEATPGPRELLEGFTAFAEAAEETAPFLVATPAVQSALESALVTGVAREAGGANAQERAAETVAGLRETVKEPEAFEEIRGCYRIAMEIGEDDRALDLVLTTSAPVALGRMESELPQLHGLIRRHVDEYGWLRTDGLRFVPLAPRELVERIQAVLLRWKPEMVRQAARRRSSDANVEQSLGFSPSESLARLIGVLQDLLTSRWRSFHLQAACIARPFLARIAETLGCNHEQLVFSSGEEIMGALTRQAALPIAEIDRRMHQGFTVERSPDGMGVAIRDTPLNEGAGRQADATTLSGQSVSLGRAAGPVRIIFGPSEAVTLETGDVLVTAASTPDLMGIVSAFPSRTDAPPGMERVAAIVTDEGGLLSHAAILSREHRIPCVVGTERATRALADGQVVEVDATRATGRIIALDGC